jgi:sigma-B regulation protein RsbU (phosphoserine phosphatase)
MILDRVSGEVKVSNAGHPPLILVRGRGVKVLDLDSGPPLGIVSQDYTCTTLNLKRGDRLIMLTDGVFEAKNKYGKRIGFKNIVNFVRNNTNKTDMTNEIYDFVSRHSKGVMMSDDLTIVCLTYIS